MVYTQNYINVKIKKGDEMMKYVCHNYFMSRTTVVPLNYLTKFEEQREYDIYEFIKQDKKLDLYFQEALFIASPSLYYSYMKNSITPKKYKNLKESLLKYFIRSTTRPTPFGLFSIVSLGMLGDETIIEFKNDIIDIMIEKEWINKVRYLLEKSVLTNLKFKINNMAYISGDRYYIPYIGEKSRDSSQDYTSELSIRYTDLVNLLEKNLQNYVSYNLIEAKIKEKYINKTTEEIKSLILNLLENQIIYSNLKEDTYCGNNLVFMLEILKNIKYDGEILTSLEELVKLINKYEEKREFSFLNLIVNKMKSITNSSSYISINKGATCERNTLNKDISKKIEDFLEIIHKIPVKCSKISRFKSKFLDYFGEYEEVSFLKIIDKNQFDGLQYVSNDYDYKYEDINFENKINDLIDSKISEALVENKEEIILDELDFKHLGKDINYVKSLDLNIIVNNRNEDKNIFIGPAVASSKAGSMIQRFSNCIDRNMLEKYREIYQIEKELFNKYMLVELREENKDSRVNNIINKICNYNYTLSIGGICENNPIFLKDLLIGIDKMGDMYVRKRGNYKKIKFVCDNVLNINLCSPIFKLLKGISEDGEYYPEFRINEIRNFSKYKYTPRIIIKDIVVSNRKWRLNVSDLNKESLENFKKDLLRKKYIYNIPDVVYLVRLDNRLRINFKSNDYLSIIYKEFLRDFNLVLEEIEIEDVFCNSNTVENLTEYTLSFYSEGIENNEVPAIRDSEIVHNFKTEFRLLEGGWIYFKLYCSRERANEILAIYLKKLKSILLNENCFFVRYTDEKGDHLRIRFKFSNEKEAQSKLPIILTWGDELKSKRLINNIVFDTYIREVSRYGGEEFISLCEKEFFINSNIVTNMMLEKDIDMAMNIEYLSYLGALNILFSFVDDFMELERYLDNRAVYNEKYKHEFKRRKIEINNLVLSILFNKISVSKKLSNGINEEKELLKNISIKCTNNGVDKSIIFSIVHMFFNRLGCDRDQEERYIYFLRESMKCINEMIRRGVIKHE